MIAGGITRTHHFESLDELLRDIDMMEAAKWSVRQIVNIHFSEDPAVFVVYEREI